MRTTDVVPDPGEGATSEVIKTFRRLLPGGPLPFSQIFVGNMPSNAVRHYLEDRGFGFMFSGERDLPEDFDLTGKVPWIPEPEWESGPPPLERFRKVIEEIKKRRVPPRAYILPPARTTEEASLYCKWAAEMEREVFLGARPTWWLGVDVSAYPSPSDLVPYKNAVDGLSLTVPKHVEPGRWRPFALWAQARDLHVHVRKVHGLNRMMHAWSLGVDSIDSAASMMGDGTVRFVSALRTIMQR